jgi:hypothetical protein
MRTVGIQKVVGKTYDVLVRKTTSEGWGIGSEKVATFSRRQDAARCAGSLHFATDVSSVEIKERELTEMVWN